MGVEEYEWWMGIISEEERRGREDSRSHEEREQQQQHAKVRRATKMMDRSIAIEMSGRRGE